LSAETGGKLGARFTKDAFSQRGAGFFCSDMLKSDNENSVKVLWLDNTTDKGGMTESVRGLLSTSMSSSSLLSENSGELVKRGCRQRDELLENGVQARYDIGEAGNRRPLVCACISSFSAGKRTTNENI